MSPRPLSFLPAVLPAACGLLFAACGLLFAACGGAPQESKPKVVTKAVPYTHEGVELEGYIAYDANRKGKRPGILVIHEWWGLTDHPKERARRLAELGYVAFCVDMYGKGKVTDDPKQAGAWAGAFYNDRAGFGRARLKAGYDVLAARERVDATRIGAMGFCYGGSVALEAAWANMGVKGVVSFHGALTTPSEADAKNVKAAILVCTGADDAMVPPDQVQAFEDTLDKAGAVYKVLSYPGAVHAFTNKGADAHGMPNVKYNQAADEQSWEAMTAFWKQHLVGAP